MLELEVQILIDEILLTRPYGHLQGGFLVFYYCHDNEKSNNVVAKSLQGWHMGPSAHRVHPVKGTRIASLNPESKAVL